MSSRFHNKFHRHNHHTDPSTDLRYPDSSHDPIASYDSPFLGAFVLSGSLICTSPLSSYSAYISNNDKALLLESTNIALSARGHTFLQGVTCESVEIAGSSYGINSNWQGGTDFFKLFANNSDFSEQAIAFQETGTNVGAKIGVKNTANGAYDIIFANRENTSTTSTMSEKMRITNAGNVGIGTATPGYQLELTADSAAKPSTSTWTVISDERVKENIRPYDKGLNALTAIAPVMYDYNGKAGIFTYKDNIGVVAQEVQDIIPECVSAYSAKLNETDETDTELLNFNPHALTFILINSIKELKTTIDTQSEQISALELLVSGLV